MRVKVDAKVTNPMPGVLAWPSRAISDEYAETVVVTNKSTGKPVEITVTRADFLSLRETRDSDKYLAVTNEVVMYGYRPIAEPRFSNIVGLDVEADGTLIPLEELQAKHSETFAKWRGEQFEARRGAIAVSDL